jgi:hypothetical protein
MTNHQYSPAVIDHLRSVQLANGYLAATLLDASGVEYLVLVSPAGIGRTAMFDPACAAVLHEQLGEWPIPEPSEPEQPVDLGHRAMRWPGQ